MWSVVVLAATLVTLGALAMLYRVEGLDRADRLASTFGPPLAIIALVAPLSTWLWRRGSAAAGLQRSDLIKRAVESLAQSQAEQWGAEEVTRKVLDPWPLPVRWDVTPKAGALMVSWPAILGVPGGQPIAMGGTYRHVAEIFTRRDSPRRLVILGEPGAGKSTLVLRLSLDLLARRAATDPVPVLLSIATWNPDQPLDEWIAERLAADNRGLACPVRAADGTRRSLARELIATDRILPVLDGLDEMAEQHRDAAITAIADTLGSRRQFVLTSRTAEYEDAVAAGKLARTPVVEILPLDICEVTTYLVDGADDPTRWTGILTHLRTCSGTPLIEVLTTPLMLWLARFVYHHADTTPDEILTSDWARRRDGIERHLLGGLISAAYTHPIGNQPRRTSKEAENARRSLTNIAKHLHFTSKSYDLEWWRIRRMTVPLQWLLTVGLAVAVVFASMSKPPQWLALGLLPVLATAVLTSAVAREPRRIHVTLSIRRIARLAIGLAFGVYVGLKSVPQIGGLALLIWPIFGMYFTVFMENLFSLAKEPIGTLYIRGDATRAVSPVRLMREDRRFALTTAVTVGFPVGLVSGLVCGWAFGRAYDTISAGVAAGLTVGVATGAAVGVMAVVGLSAWGQFCIARAVLALRGRAPLRLMTFLQDAYTRGILRQAGGVYQFRHARLQDHLVATATEPQVSTSGVVAKQ